MVGIPLREITNINYLQSKHILFFLTWINKTNQLTLIPISLRRLVFLSFGIQNDIEF